MPKRIIVIVLIFLCSSCTTYKAIREKDYPRKSESFAIVNLFNDEISGNGYRYFGSKQFNATVDWNINDHISILVQNLLNKNEFVNTRIYSDLTDVNDKITISELLKNINSKTKNVPDYYVVLIPKQAQNSITGSSGIGSGGDFAILAIPVILISWGISHNYVKYSDLDIPANPIYKTSEEHFASSLKISSFGGAGSKQSSCNLSFDLLLIDRKKSQLIAFKNNDIIGKLSNYYEWTKFDSFSSFTSEEKGDIKKECFQIVDKEIEDSLKDIGIIK